MTQNPYDPQAAASPVSGGYFPGQVPGVPGAPAQRLVAMEEEPEEKMIEAALRPKSLDDFVGQRRVRSVQFVHVNAEGTGGNRHVTMRVKGHGYRLPSTSPLTAAAAEVRTVP